MIQPLRYYLHLILAFILLGTQALSYQSNTIQSLSPFQAERMLGRAKFNNMFSGLGSTKRIDCSRVCTESRQLTDAEATYSLGFEAGEALNLTLYPADNENSLTVSLEVVYYSFSMSVHITSYHPQNLSKAFERSWDAHQKKGVFTVPGPIQRLEIYVTNQDWSKTLSLKISPHNNPVWIIPVAALIGGLVGFMVVVLFNYLKARHRRNRERGYIQLQQLAVQEIIDTRFPETKFSQFQSDFSQKTCSICLEDMQADQLCRQLDCQHIFHSHCGNKWLQNQFENRNKVSCPNCNQQVNIVKQEFKDLERGNQ